MTYGAYVNELLGEEEKTIFKEFYDLLHEDFVLNKSSDRMSAELACIYFVKLTRAIKSGNAEAIYKMDLLVRNQLKDLKATKDTPPADEKDKDNVALDDSLISAGSLTPLIYEIETEDREED